MSGRRTCASPSGSAAPNCVSVATKLAPKSRQSFAGSPALKRFLSWPWLNTVLIAGRPMRSICVPPASVADQTPMFGWAESAVSVLLGSEHASRSRGVAEDLGNVGAGGNVSGVLGGAVEDLEGLLVAPRRP